MTLILAGTGRRPNVRQKGMHTMRTSLQCGHLYKQHMWRAYKHTGNDQYYEVYKEALNASTNEVRKPKRAHISTAYKIRQ